MNKITIPVMDMGCIKIIRSEKQTLSDLEYLITNFLETHSDVYLVDIKQISPWTWMIIYDVNRHNDIIIKTFTATSSLELDTNINKFFDENESRELVDIKLTCNNNNELIAVVIFKI